MKNTFRFLMFVLVLSAVALSACSGASTQSSGVGGGKPQAMVAYTGIVESIDGTQWVINGKTVTVDPSIVRDGPFNVGDRIKVEGTVNPDGSFTASRVEMPSASDISTLPQFGDDNSNANSNDVNSNDANINDNNGNDINANDNNGNDINSNDVNGNDVNSNDVNGNEVNSNDANGNEVNSNDANGNSANSNSDNSNTATNSNDDKGGSSGGGGGNDNGGGGGGNGNGG